VSTRSSTTTYTIHAGRSSSACSVLPVPRSHARLAVARGGRLDCVVEEGVYAFAQVLGEAL